MGIYSTSNSEEVKKQRAKYRKELADHKDLYMEIFGRNLDKIRSLIPDSEVKELMDSAYTHDDSKTSIEEFESYRQYKFPASGETPNEEEYLLAKQHHLHLNKHHWEHWCMIKPKGVIKPLLIPTRYVIEIALDFITSAVEEKISPMKYYDNIKKDMIINSKSDELLKEFLKLFK